MKKKDPSVTWKTLGRKLKVDGTGKPTGTGTVTDSSLIDVKELDKSFAMPGYEDAAIAGMPINANLAVRLIRNFHKKLPKIPQDALEGSFKIEKTYSLDEVEVTKEWLVKLLLFSRAITIDKNVLLKTISQPGCEGVRFYLCLKDNEQPNPKPKEIMSLVVVGVDKDGKDHLYEFDPETKSQIKDGDKYTLENGSLSSEYNYPPPPQSFSKSDSESAYVLGEYAWDDVYDKFLQK